MGCHSLLQENILTQESNWGLPHCRQILYRLSHQGSLTSILLMTEGFLLKTGYCCYLYIGIQLPPSFVRVLYKFSGALGGGLPTAHLPDVGTLSWIPSRVTLQSLVLLEFAHQRQPSWERFWTAVSNQPLLSLGHWTLVHA